ncbi:Bromodomain-containing protein [Pseudohyphozyma bogoriensis]|nr:Bromodomain-containing protein [Pseudohyphozyma bogoriensis]
MNGRSESPDRERKRPLDADPNAVLLEHDQKRHRGEGSAELPPAHAKIGINSPAVDAVGLEEVKRKGLFLYEQLTSPRDSYGRQICTEFMMLPSPQMYPDYYQLIQKPIS